MNVPPLQIYLAWHPNFTGAKDLPNPPRESRKSRLGLETPRQKTNARAVADEIAKRFAGQGMEFLERQGIPIEVRSAAHPDSDYGLPLDIDLNQADMTLIVPLIDNAMINDNDWERWIKDYDRDDKVRVLPVAISKPGLKLFETQHSSQLFEHPINDRPDALFRDIMIYCAWILNEARPKLFLSYHNDPAKNDSGEATGYRGQEIARHLHHTIINHYVGVDCFFAPKSIFLTEHYEQRIREEISQTSALISILTPSYHTRDWCQLEVSCARSPQQIVKGKNCWAVTPLVLVDGLLDSCSKLPQEFGGCHMTRWRSESPLSLKRTAMDIIDRALFEVVNTSFDRRWAEKLVADDLIVINWIPDPLSVLKLRKALGPDFEFLDDEGNKTKIVYPGHGLSDVDKEFLETTIPGVEFCRYRDEK